MLSQKWVPLGGGSMGELIRSYSWERTPVGSFDIWPQSLRTALGIMLDSGYAMYIAWGPEFIQFYNDAYRPILGATKHPAALGAGTRETFAEIWDFIGPMFRRVMERGESTSLVDQILPLNRYGYLEECYFTFSYSAIRDEGSGVGGVLVTVIETTRNVVDERRLRGLRELASWSGAARDSKDVRARVRKTLCSNPFDLPSAELLTRDDLRARGIEVPRENTYTLIPYSVESPAWPGEFTSQAMLLPLARAGGEAADYLMVGISPRRALDANYESFLQLLARQIAMALDNAGAYEAERQRAEGLAELDRAKTTFFSNVSHEFRTPLTLLLAPLEDALSRREALPEDLRKPLEMAQRNSQRLLRLVNTLLEFSRIEAGRVQAARQLVRLEQITAEIASSFRSAVENAGLRFEVECEQLPGAVLLDPDMWEKVVLNLISNAFKFTFQGSIAVRLRAQADAAILEVADTGTGIPQSELPHIFKRFHRVEGAHSRTFEGSGIGLALVAELVRLQGGAISVESEVGKGSVFRVSVPVCFSQDAGTNLPAPRLTHTFLAEAERWAVPAPSVPAPPVPEASISGRAPEGRVLFADDNADMREYVTRILTERFTIMAVPDGEQALAAIPGFQPDLVLCDVMMPRRDGYQLLTAIRGDEALRQLPVVLLSARAGEEARVEGIEFGANDYLVKPFSPRELLARVTSQVTISRLRKRFEATERALRDDALDAERRFRHLLMQTPAAITLLRGPEHVFELANQEYLAMVGRTEAELIGRRVLDVFPEVVGQGFIEILDGVFRTATPYIGREKFLSLEREGQSPSEIYLNFVYQPVMNHNGVTEGILFHGADVSDLVRARNASEAGERQLRTLAETIPQLVWSCRPDGRCDYLSKQWITYTGVPEEEQLGLGWLNVLHPDDRERTFECWTAAVEDRGVYDIEYRIRRFDGSFRWFKTRGTPVRDSAGAVDRWFGTCTDIEDQKLAERHMLEQQKLESIGLLAGGIAHDFNNLLVGVLCNASLIDETLADNHPLRPTVRGIVEAGERASHLTRQMLAYAGKGNIFVERVDVNSLVRSTASLVEASFPRSVRLVLEMEGDPPSIEADSGQIQQVVMNLAINGAEAIGEKKSGSVWIRTGLVEVRGAYLEQHRFVGDPPRQGLYACIEVEDTGSGIAPDTLTKIFDPFFTTKFTGRGLGLAAVLGIVRSAGGGIEVLSEVGHGTLFRVLLPVGAGGTSPERAVHTLRLQEPNGMPAVLVIDDEQIVRQTTRAALRKAGYEVILAESGEEGLALFTARSHSIGLVILDMSMPGMNGKETMEKLRRIHRTIPVLIFSGYSEQQVHQHFEGLNISGFLQKPFSSHQIASAVHELLSVPAA
jgi:PAS domain S-box-containing protein